MPRNKAGIAKKTRTPEPTETDEEEKSGGGGNTETIWEELDKLPKDDLIIQLVKTEREAAMIRNTLRELAAKRPSEMDPSEGFVPTAEWLEKIIAFLKKDFEDKELYEKVVDHGVDWEFAYDYFRPRFDDGEGGE